jgi:UDP-N-acetylmuramoyl-tripeptide--D-alanyl-D-alanine ligase
MTIDAAAKIMNGRGGKGNLELVRDVCIDSRSAKPGDLFFALKGLRTDGHLFVKDAVGRGAMAAVVERECGNAAQIIIRDTLAALGDLARCYRAQFKAPLVGITGTNGKTTVKNLVAAILAKRYRTACTRGNQNSLIGLPLTLFTMNDSTEFVVAEMGTSSPGEIGRLCAIGRPRYGLITNIGPGHLAGLGTCEQVEREKLALIRALPANGFGVVGETIGQPENGATIHRFSERMLGDVALTERGSAFTFEGNRFRTPLLGMGNVSNCLAALVLTSRLGIEAQCQQSALQEARFEPGRMEPLLNNGLLIINDTYNANPVSMRMAIDFASLINRRRVFVLGDMLELGDDTEKYHREIGDHAREHCDQLLTCGREARHFGGRHFADKMALVSHLLRQLNGDELVLVKASRALMFEEIVSELARS